MKTIEYTATYLFLFMFNGAIDNQVQGFSKSFSLFAVWFKRIYQACCKLFNRIRQFVQFFHVWSICLCLVAQISTNLQATFKLYWLSQLYWLELSRWKCRTHLALKKLIHRFWEPGCILNVSRAAKFWNLSQGPNFQNVFFQKIHVVIIRRTSLAELADRNVIQIREAQISSE